MTIFMAGETQGDCVSFSLVNISPIVVSSTSSARRLKWCSVLSIFSFVIHLLYKCLKQQLSVAVRRIVILPMMNCMHPGGTVRSDQLQPSCS